MYKKLSTTIMIGAILFVTSILAIRLTNPSSIAAQTDAIPDFVGAAVCADCHADIVDQHAQHGHNYILNRVEGAAPVYPHGMTLEPPAGYTWDQISFVIGGFNWQARFIDQNGYIVTGDVNAATQYNFPLVDEREDEVIVEGAWTPYQPGEEVPYNCGSCHTTGYNHDTNSTQDNRPGLVGQWEEDGIQCEECHGPGSLHVENPVRVNMWIDRSNSACGNCHSRADSTVIETAGGFIDHHQQYDEVQVTPHAALDCVTCHDPHQSTVSVDEAINPNQGLRSQCVECHFAQDGTRGAHTAMGVTCVDCHMAPIVLSGNSNADWHWADVNSHLFRINVNPDAPQFSEDGTQTMPCITLEYACLRCHPDRDMDDIVERATGYHGEE